MRTRGARKVLRQKLRSTRLKIKARRNSVMHVHTADHIQGRVIDQKQREFTLPPLPNVMSTGTLHVVKCGFQ